MNENESVGTGTAAALAATVTPAQAQSGAAPGSESSSNPLDDCPRPPAPEQHHSWPGQVYGAAGASGNL